MTVLDHFLAFLLVFGFPLYFVRATPATRKAIEAGEPGRRARDYWHTLFELWFMGLAVAGLWWAFEREWWEIGLWWSGGWKFWLLMLAALAFGGLVVAQVRAVRQSAPTREQIRRRMEHVAYWMPRSRHELRLFNTLSISAGVCEEIAYRGFLIWYFQGFAGMPGGALGRGAGAVVLSSLAFGFAHLYVGWRDALRSTVAGGFLAAVYLAAGSLWPAMLFHALIDLNSGALAWIAFTDEGGDATAAEGGRVDAEGSST